MRRADRQEGNQRRYSDEDIRCLTFRRCREFGFAIEWVSRLVGLMHGRSRSCLEANDLAYLHLQEVRASFAVERSVAEFVRTCDADCAGAAGPDCIVLSRLWEAPGPTREREAGPC